MALTLSSLTSTSFFSDNAPLLKRYRYFRIFLYLSNFIIFALGIASLGTASTYLTSAAATLLTTSLAVGAIVLGIFAILLSIWGFFAAFRESKFALLGYEIVVAVVAVSMLGVGIAVAAQNSDAGTVIVNAWEDLYNEHDWNTLNSVQQAFDCCGLFNYSDSWTPAYLYYYAAGNVTLNITLCPGSGISLDTRTHQDVHPVLSSCYDAIHSLYTKNVAAAAGVVLTLSLLLLATVVISVLATLAIRRMQKEQQERTGGEGDGADKGIMNASREFHVAGDRRLREQQAEVVVDGADGNGNEEAQRPY